MKKILSSLMILAGLSFMFSACSSSEKPGPDPEENKMPVTDLKIPSSVQAGATFLLGGENFPSDSKIFLQQNNTSNRQNLSFKKVAQGLECSVSKETPAGIYELYLSSGKNEWRLTSSLDIKEAEMELPVIGLKIPATVEAGKSFTMTGAGFPKDSKVFLSLTPSGEKIELQLENNPAGLVCHTSKNLAPGSYYILLASGKNEWVLNTDKNLLEVTEAVKIKKVIGVQHVISENNYLLRDIGFVYDEDGKIVKISDPELIVDNFERNFTISLSENGFSGVNTEKMYNGEFQGFDFSISNGKIINSSFTVYKDKKSEIVDWDYDEEDHCITFENEMNKVLNFQDSKTKNNPSGLDVAKLIYFITQPIKQQQTNLALIYATSLGMTGANYSNLPTSFLFKEQSDQDGFEENTVLIDSYEKDTDGYVTCIRFTDPSKNKISINIKYQFI